MCTYECEMTYMDYLHLLLDPIKRVSGAMTEFPWLKAGAACVASFVSFFIHGNVLGIVILLSLIVIDQLTGVWLATKRDVFNSSAFRNGLVKTLFYLIIIAAFHSLSYISPLFEWLSLDTAALAWLTMTEVISIVENSCLILDLPFPNWILDKLRIFIRFGASKDKKD